MTIFSHVLFVQLMETGESGIHGQIAVKHVVLESRLDPDCVTTHNLPTVGLIVRGLDKSKDNATLLEPAKVSYKP